MNEVNNSKGDLKHKKKKMAAKMINTLKFHFRLKTLRKLWSISKHKYMYKWSTVPVFQAASAFPQAAVQNLLSVGPAVISARPVTYQSQPKFRPAPSLLSASPRLTDSLLKIDATFRGIMQKMMFYYKFKFGDFLAED